MFLNPQPFFFNHFGYSNRSITRDLPCDYVLLSPKVKADPKDRKPLSEFISLPILSQRLC